MSLRRVVDLFIARALMPALFLFVGFPALAQYPGQVAKDKKEAPVLRSIAVLEWTGPEENPKASRLVPVLVYDDGQMQDGSIYLARPAPIAVAPDVEYELQENGKPVGLFDLMSTGQQLGSWVGFGAWKPMTAAPPRTPPKPTLPEWGMDNQEGDRPILHRKKHADEASTSGASPSGQASGTPAAPSDPDRPVLHKSKSADGDDTSASTSTSGTSSSGAAPDSDRPVLHKKDSDSDNTASSSAPSDPDRPVLKKTKKTQPTDVGNVSSMPGSEDPDRPRLKRGLANMDKLKVLPSLIGLPPDLEQSVAVSDARNRPEHPFGYNWADPALEAKMKSSLEDIARDALGLKPPSPAPKPKTTPAAQKATTATHRTLKPPLPAEPAPLMDERFNAFELTYGSEATLVLTAHTDAGPAQVKFVTLIAQPDFYGNLHVVLKTVADAAHLDDNPRLRLVDAVDALADNRGELLFEMRGATQRQFALYRIARGQAEKLFVTGGGQYGADPNN
jgi:hypothetical protein